MSHCRSLSRQPSRSVAEFSGRQARPDPAADVLSTVDRGQNSGAVETPRRADVITSASSLSRGASIFFFVET